MRRREFLIGISSAMALVASSCRRPQQEIVPAVIPVEYQVPGVSLYYSSVFCQKNAAYGISVKTREGRPIKIEGNPSHPINNGTSNALMQAALYDLYNPKRFRKPKVNNEEKNLNDCMDLVFQKLDEYIANNKKIAILHDEHCSPLFEKLMLEISETQPLIEFVTFPGLVYPNEAKANKILFGIDGEIIPDLSKTKHFDTFNSDFLGGNKNSLYYTNSFYKSKKKLNINNINLGFSVFESKYTLTGTNTYSRNFLNVDKFEIYLAALLVNLIKKSNFDGLELLREKLLNKLTTNFEFIIEKLLNQLPIEYLNNQTIKENASQLITLKESTCVLIGQELSLQTHILGNLINYVLGNYDKAKIFDTSRILPISNDNSIEIKKFSEKINNNEFGYFMMLGLDSIAQSNPLLNKIPSENLLNLSFYENQINKASIELTQTHFLEEWGDAITFDGTYSIQQPVIAPLNENSISINEFLYKILEHLNPQKTAPSQNIYEYLKNFSSRYIPKDSDWDETLKNGFIKKQNNSVYKEIKLNIEQIIENLSDLKIPVQSEKLYLTTSLSPIWQNSSNFENPLLNEIPHPLTNQVYGSAVQISKELADKENLKDGDVIEIKIESEPILKTPVLILDYIISNVLNFEYGKENYAQLTKAFFDLQSCQTNYYKEVIIKKTGEEERIYKVQKHEFDNAENLFFNDSYKKKQNNNQSIYPGYEYRGNRWAMSVDLALCTGCNACMAACNVENNIPLVGPEEINKDRDMFWIRIEKYKIKKYERNVFLPILCQHCEQAPCESVCPVYASTHSPEGLNETTYNRCIGSRYCMANCPYKVRKFNFKNNLLNVISPQENMLNPDVTVRSRGVVEKCTFCIQRINEARYNAQDEGLNSIPDGAIKTACQQACPAEAIVFGNKNDPNSLISKMIRDKRAYSLLGELDTKPSVVYLKKVQ